MGKFNPKANNISWKAIDNTKVVSQGRYGKIEKGTWTYLDAESNKIQEEVAIKKCKQASKFDVWNERDRLSALEHPNLAKLLGIVQSGRPGAVPSLVMEYLQGDLRSYILDTRRTGGLSAWRMAKISHGIASGMNYLHQQGIVHGDLAARNVLVDDNNQVKINDFGFYDEKMNGQFYLNYNEPNCPCPVAWMPPENLPYRLGRRGRTVPGKPKLSKDGDIWSFGVVLFEIWSRGEIPFDGFDLRTVCELLLHSKKPTHYLAVSMRDHVWQCMHSCWKLNPSTRPLFSIIMKHFENHEDLSPLSAEKKEEKKVEKKKKKKGKKTEKKDEKENKNEKENEEGNKNEGENKNDEENKIEKDSKIEEENKIETGNQPENQTVIEIGKVKTDDCGYVSSNDNQNKIEIQAN